ncbi:MAG: hypothetical protein KAT53_00175 [Dehalococcoidia bacterium]|nr:hypothetical protein [Dehalococcoidia bacterium]
MTRVIVKSGICGFISTIEVDKVADESFKVVITSGCEMVTELGESLTEIDEGEVLKRHIDTEVYKSASRCKLHTTCPVPMAVLKAIEAEAELALPRDVVVIFDTMHK